MYDPLARHVLDRLLARQDVRLRRLIEEIAPVALAARSVEALADMVLDAVVLAPLALDAAALIGPERTDGACAGRLVRPYQERWRTAASARDSEQSWHVLHAFLRGNEVARMEIRRDTSLVHCR